MQKGLKQSDAIDSAALTENAWLEVIQQMEHAYKELINHQVELEHKNRELEQVNQLISSVQRSMTEVLLVTDLSGKVIQVNHSLTELNGLEHKKLIGLDIDHLFSSQDHNTISLVHQQKEFSQQEVTLVLSDQQYPIVLNGSRLLDGNQQIQGMVLVGREISELRRAYKELADSHHELKVTQEQLVNAEKMASLGRLVAGVAHELNNPISFIYGNTHALMSYTQKLIPFLEQIKQVNLSEVGISTESTDKVNKIMKDLPSLLDGTLEGVERVRDIVMDLRQFSSGQQYQCRQFDLVHTLDTSLRWLLKDQQVTISTDLPNELTIEGQPGRIQQVLMNLIQNALDAIEQQPKATLNISLKELDDHALLSIADNGCGIPEDILPHIFEPFVTSKDSGKGTGLGLSLSYRFVTDHGGSLSAENQPDGGALFTLKLPLQFKGER